MAWANDPLAYQNIINWVKSLCTKKNNIAYIMLIVSKERAIKLPAWTIARTCGSGWSEKAIVGRKESCT